MNFISEYAGSSDTLVQFGLWATIGAVSITILLIIYILIFRSYQLLILRANRGFYHHWRPLLAQASFHLPDRLPQLKSKNHVPLLSMWNHYFEIVHGDAHDNLIALAHRIQLDHIARMQLLRHDKKHVLLGILTLGNLKSRQDWPLLNMFVHLDDSNISLVALRALFRIHPERAMHTLLPYLVTRRDFPAPQVATLLKRLPVNEVCPQLILHMGLNVHTASSSLLRYMEACGCSINRQVFSSLIERKPDDHIISVALAMLSDPNAIELITPYVSHKRWHVRVHAARALGKLAKPEHVPYLVQLLSDEQWWVRYRAAQALVSLPFMNQAQLDHIGDELGDRYGLDILRQAMAEQAI
ncbi:MAG: HEAT repeat domain-containing protein [Gammaproteobacteria bacterium]|nr:HEAT repeat domain-containing protein [Gammaproteobacteria bacterium]